MKYGNYCGPYWSDGAWQTSVVGTREPIDEFDNTCRLHDAQYAIGGDLKEADFEFYRQNIGKGFVRSLAALGVGAQGLIRRGGGRAAPNNSQTQGIMTNGKSQLRGAAQPQAKTQRAAQLQQSKANKPQAIVTTAVPAAIGTTMRTTKPQVVRAGNSARITGRDFVGSVQVETTTGFGLSLTALLNPAYFSSAFLGNLCRSYENYKWNRLRIHYVPAVATTTPGAILLASAHSVTMPALSGEASNFLPRAMTQGNAALAPIWEHNYIDIDCDRGGKRAVDPTTSTDLDDNIHEELQVYFSATSAGTAGYLFAEYDCTFHDPVYQPHSTTIPIPYGPGTRVDASEFAVTGAAGDDWGLSFLTGITLSSVANGTIFRGVFDITGAIPATATTLNNLLHVTTFSHSTTTAFAVTTQNFPLVGGTVVYFVVDGSQVKVYTSIEAARTGLGSGQLVVRTAYTGIGSYSFIVALVGLDNASIASIQ